MLSVDDSDFNDTESYFTKLVRYFPLVSNMSKDSSLYRTLLPFSAKTEMEFQSWPLTKQKASEVNAKTSSSIGYSIYIVFSKLLILIRHCNH